MSKIEEKEIIIGSDQRAFFLHGQEDNNRWYRNDERLFLQEFLEFYNEAILKSGEQFNYETFYDFYSGYTYKKENKDTIESFYNGFNEKYPQESGLNRDCHNRIADFDRTFSQLLASQFHKAEYLQDISTLNYPLYESFIHFLSKVLETHDVKFHTLNHDVLFDWLGSHHSLLWQHFSDGFELWGSPFYGQVPYNFKTRDAADFTTLVHKEYYVKLERFTNRFDKPLSYFKLHGSILNTKIYSEGTSAVRIKDMYGVNRYCKEVTNATTGIYSIEGVHDQVAPDFLSGTTNKIRYYTGDEYYGNLFKHFENNLEGSNLLIVIGYGFQDPGVNEYIENHFLKLGKKMVVVDPCKPSTELLDKYNSSHIHKSITAVSYQEFIGLMKTIDAV